MTTVITYADAIARVTPFAEARPDAKVSCSYFERKNYTLGAANCIVGCAFEDLLRPVIEAHPAKNTSRISVLTGGSLLGDNVTFTRKARLFLSHLQDAQDSCVPWSRALSDAVAYVERLNFSDTVDA